VGCGEGHQSHHESGIPTVYLESLLYKYLKRLDEEGEFVPSCAVAGGITFEDQVFKAIALAAPYVMEAVGFLNRADIIRYLQISQELGAESS